jgi:hypothetical protein
MQVFKRYVHSTSAPINCSHDYERAERVWQRSDAV